MKRLTREDCFIGDLTDVPTSVVVACTQCSMSYYAVTKVLDETPAGVAYKRCYFCTSKVPPLFAVDLADPVFGDR